MNTLRNTNNSKKALFILGVIGMCMTNQLIAVTTGVTASGLGVEEGVGQLLVILSGPISMIIGAIALVIGVITFLLSNDDNMAPVMRITLKVVFCISIMLTPSILTPIFMPASAMLP